MAPQKKGHYSPQRRLSLVNLLRRHWFRISLLTSISVLAMLKPVSAKDHRTLASLKSASSTIPEDAQKALSELPEKKITLDLILGAGMKSSDSFQVVVSGAAAIGVSKHRAEAVLDPQLKVYAQTQDNQNEAQSVFQPSRTLTDGYGVGVSKYFSSGTSLAFELKHGSYAYSYPTGSPLPDSGTQYMSEAKLAVSQNLWNDAFGVSTRKGLMAAQKQSVVAREAVVENVEGWARQLIDFYYKVWLAQNGVRAATLSLERRERLVDITQTKLRRGTAERPDLLQVEAARISSRVQLSEKSKVLSEVWRNLVTTLKFPNTWLEIDPVHIPMAMDDPIPRAKELCGGSNYLAQRPEKTTTLNKLEHQAEATQLVLEKAEGGFKPKLSLDLSYNANGLDAQTSNSMEEVFSSTHPGWAAQLTLTYPFGNDGARAEYVAALSESQRAQGLSQQAQANLSVDWLNQCKDLYRQIEKVQQLTDAFNKQMERVKLEEGRFRFGRSPTMSVIQAGDDATIAEVELMSAQADTRRVAWSIRHLGGDIMAYLEKIRGEAFVLK